MKPWQVDVVGGFHLADGTELNAVSGIDDSSRFGVSAALVRRATARPVCEALLAARRRHGIPDQILTDNGKVFTSRFGSAGVRRRCCSTAGAALMSAANFPSTPLFGCADSVGSEQLCEEGGSHAAYSARFVRRGD